MIKSPVPQSSKACSEVWATEVDRRVGGCNQVREIRRNSLRINEFSLVALLMRVIRMLG